jgi:enoyl-CoA hydratase/carnithine racemase
MNKKDAATFEVIDCIGIISLNDPPANELSRPEFIPIGLFTEWTSSPTLKGLIIKGEGKNFSAGGNLAAIFRASHDPDALKSMMEDGLKLLSAIHNLEIPVIAAINRVCFGGGLEIALACHIRVASENALLAFPEVNQNLMPGMGGTTRLPAFAGISESIKIILGGDMVNAADARALGFIDHVAPKDQAFEYAWAMMQKMTRDRPVKVIRSIMKALKNATVMPPEEAMKEETQLFCSLAQDEAGRRKTGEA